MPAERDPGTPSLGDPGVSLLWVTRTDDIHWDHRTPCPFPKVPLLSQLKGVGARVSTKDRSVALGLRTSDSNSINRGRSGRGPRERPSSRLQDTVEQGERVESKESQSVPLNKSISSPNIHQASPRRRLRSERWQARSLSQPTRKVSRQDRAGRRKRRVHRVNEAGHR